LGFLVRGVGWWFGGWLVIGGD